MHDTDPHEELTPAELELADRLAAERPTPGTGFRGGLARYLAARDPGYGPRPEDLHLAVAGYLLIGLLLIAAGALVALS